MKILSSILTNFTGNIATSGSNVNDMSSGSSSTRLNISSATIYTQLEFINWPEEENQKCPPELLRDKEKHNALK